MHEVAPYRAQIGPNSALFANFDGELSGVHQLYTGKGGILLVW